MQTQVGIQVANATSSAVMDVAELLPGGTSLGQFWAHRTRTVDPTRVLIVDADFSHCASLAVLVHVVGSFETRIACSSRTALSTAAEFLPGIILINTDVSGLASFGLASALHQRSGLSDARLIALTSGIAGANRSQALAAGFEQYLSLPVQQGALERVLMPRARASALRGWGQAAH